MIGFAARSSGGPARGLLPEASVATLFLFLQCVCAWCATLAAVAWDRARGADVCWGMAARLALAATLAHILGTYGMREITARLPTVAHKCINEWIESCIVLFCPAASSLPTSST